MKRQAHPHRCRCGARDVHHQGNGLLECGTCGRKVNAGRIMIRAGKHRGNYNLRGMFK